MEYWFVPLGHLLPFSINTKLSCQLEILIQNTTALLFKFMFTNQHKGSSSRHIYLIARQVKRSLSNRFCRLPAMLSCTYQITGEGITKSPKPPLVAPKHSQPHHGRTKNNFQSCTSRHQRSMLKQDLVCVACLKTTVPTKLC